MKPTDPKLAKILSRLKQQADAPLRLEDHLFKEQLAFVTDPSPFKTAVCSRRAGKSTGVAADLVHTAFANQGVTSLYVTGTRVDAKKIIWAEILKFNREYALGGRANISELTLSFKNGSVVRLAGAKDEQDIEKIRGQLPPVKKAYVDEAQSIRDRVLTKLIDDILEPALMDYAGSMALLGTPGPIPAGYFYEASQNSNWAHHAWTFFNNPWIKTKSGHPHQWHLDRVLKRRGVSLDDPSIQREFFGRWVQDNNSRVIHYDPLKNAQEAPSDLDSFVIGVDLGFNDADALAVIGWNANSPKSYIVHEDVTRKQGITELAAKIGALIDRYSPVKVVIDTGGLGKKVAEEMRRRYSLPIEAAEKTRKFEFIELLNDALRTSNLHAPADSYFAKDSQLLEWDRDKSKVDRMVVSDRYHSDIVDAVLYAYREALHWLHRPEKAAIQVYSEAYWKKIEEDLEAQAIRSLKKRDENDYVNKGFDPMGDE